MKPGVFRHSIVLVCAAALLVAFPVLAPTDYVVRIGNLVLVYAVLALGLNFTVGWTGQISLAHAAFWGIGAYTSAILTTGTIAWSPWLAMAGAIVVAALAGVALGLPTLKIKGHYLALATIGFGEVTRITLNNWRSLTGGSDGISDIPALSVGGFGLTSETRMYFGLLVGVAVLTAAAAQLRDSSFGRAFIAVRDDELAAGVVGVPTTTTKTLAFALGAAYAGFAGSAYAHLFHYVSPDIFSFEQSLLILSMLVIGGLGRIAGALVGALVGVALPELLRGFGVFSMAIYTLLVVLMILFVPGGVVGILTGEARPLRLDWLRRLQIRRRS